MRASARATTALSRRPDDDKDERAEQGAQQKPAQIIDPESPASSWSYIQQSGPALPKPQFSKGVSTPERTTGRRQAARASQRGPVFSLSGWMGSASLSPPSPANPGLRPFHANRARIPETTPMKRRPRPVRNKPPRASFPQKKGLWRQPPLGAARGISRRNFKRGAWGREQGFVLSYLEGGLGVNVLSLIQALAPPPVPHPKARPV